MNFLGLDIGTTTVTALVVDGESGAVVRKATAPNDAETTAAADRRRGRSEWDPDRVLARVREVLGEAGGEGGDVAALGVTGQMHGMLLVDDAGAPDGPFIGWQDQRAVEREDGGPTIETLLAAVEAADPNGHVCRPKTGYLGATLHWLSAKDRLPAGRTAVFLPDFAVARLTGTAPVTDATNAAGSGLFDVGDRVWHRPLLDRVGLDLDALPAVVDSGSRAGALSKEWSDTGLAPGIPVCAACGDNQASFLGSVKDPADSVLINVGTGGQISVSADRPGTGPGLEARPHVDGRFILVGAGLVGGRTYAWLRDFFLQVGRDLFDVEGDPETVYERMTRLAGDVGAGADGLRFEPLLTGTREDPHRRGRMEGIGTNDFTPGHLSRALLEGVVAQFRWLYDNALAVGAGDRALLIGAGNGIRKNAVLRAIAEEAFGTTMRVPRHTEEAAFGAAMQAMVLGGGTADLEGARSAIRYDEGGRRKISVRPRRRPDLR